jgi:hypothetical protein
MPVDTTFPDFCPARALSRELDWISDSDSTSDYDSTNDIDWHVTDFDRLISALHHGTIVVGKYVSVANEDALDLEVAFLGHAAKWEHDTCHVSSMTEIIQHPSYQWILAAGRKNRRSMLSLLLKDLRDRDRPWFTALALIADTNPVDPKDIGRADKMKKAWLKWGRDEALL